MTSQSRKSLIFRWTTPRNLLAILVFIIITVAIQYIIVTSMAPTVGNDPTTIVLPFNITVSFLYNLLPVAVIVTLTTSFTYLTTYTATISQSTQPVKPLQQKPRPKPNHLEPFRRFYKRLEKAYRRARNKILRTSTIAYLERRVALASAIIRSAVVVTVIFVAIILLVAVAAYPESVSAATVNFYRWNTAFLDFVVVTTRTSESIANTVAPIGVVATMAFNALFAVAPAFHNTLEGFASSLTSGIVALGPTEKYLIIQNSAAWTVALVTLFYSEYAKTRRYRR